MSKQSLIPGLCFSSKSLTGLTFQPIMFPAIMSRIPVNMHILHTVTSTGFFLKEKFSAIPAISAADTRSAPRQSIYTAAEDLKRPKPELCATTRSIPFPPAAVRWK